MKPLLALLCFHTFALSHLHTASADSARQPYINRVAVIEVNRYNCDAAGKGGALQVIYWIFDFDGRPRVRHWRGLLPTQEFEGDSGPLAWDEYESCGRRYRVEAEALAFTCSRGDPERYEARFPFSCRRSLQPMWPAGKRGALAP